MSSVDPSTTITTSYWSGGKLCAKIVGRVRARIWLLLYVAITAVTFKELVTIVCRTEATSKGVQRGCVLNAFTYNAVPMKLGSSPASISMVYPRKEGKVGCKCRNKSLYGIEDPSP